MSDERSEREIKAQAQAQYSPHAEGYVTSQIHARGWSLSRLVELVEPQSDWRVLDVATGGGHTALTFAPHVSKVVALDLTYGMLTAARKHIASQGAANVTYVQSDAGALPFPAAAFDLVTCRIAPHHFPDVGRFVRDVARVLRPGGWAAITDNTTPDDKIGATYVNAFDRLRDPSHNWGYSLEAWLVFFSDAGLEVAHHESRPVFHDLDEWAARMSVSDENRIRLRVMLRQVPAPAREVLRPRQVGDRMEFNLQETVIVGQRLPASPL